MQLAEYQHGGGERADNAERCRNEAEQDQPRRTEHPQHQQRNPAERRDTNQMHFPLRGSTRRLCVENSAGAGQGHIGEILFERAFAVRHGFVDRMLDSRFVRRTRQRRHYQNAGRIALMRHQQTVFDLQVRGRQRQP